MCDSTFDWICLVPAARILNGAQWVPKGEGVYYVFFAGGHDLLRATSYHEHSKVRPMHHKGRDVHLYTGSSRRMLARAKCHLRGRADQSGLRKTLLAAEFACQAISSTDTPACTVTDKASLDEWLLKNVHFAFIPCDDARAHEQRQLNKIASPLNIRCQRSPSFAKQLLRWRQDFFPRGQGF